jgi:hypothetical protein
MQISQGALEVTSGDQGNSLHHYLMQPMTFDYDLVKSKSFWQLHAANEMLRASRLYSPRRYHS